MLYGLENAHNWGFDWFTTLEAAIEAKRNRPKLYGHNGKPLAMTRAQIAEQNL